MGREGRTWSVAAARVIVALAGFMALTASAAGAAAPQVVPSVANPAGIAIDASGNRYVVNAGQHGGQVVKVTPAGAVSFIATGIASPDGIAVRGGDIYVSSHTGNTGSVLQITPSGVVSTYASGFQHPGALAFDANGNLYVTEGADNTLWKVPLGASPVQFATGFNVPRGVTVDNSTGNVYVSNNGDNSVSVVGKDGGVATVFATGLSSPSQLVFDAGDLYVADEGGIKGRVAQVDSAGIVTSYVTSLDYPAALTVDGADLLVASSDNTISEVGPGGSPISTSAAGFDYPGQPTFDAAGNLYVPNQRADTVSKVTPAGVISTFASGLSSPYAVAVGPSGDLYVANNGSGTVSEVDSAGSVSTFATGLSQPTALAFDGAGNLYVANRLANTVSKVGPGGGAATVFATGFNHPSGLVFDGAGNLFVSNANSPATIDEVGPDGTVGSPAFATLPSSPSSLAIRPGGQLLVGQPNDSAVLAVSPAGVQSTFADGLGDVSGLALSPSGGLYVSNLIDNTVAFIARPGAPTGMAATASDGRIDVAWSAPATDGGMPITGYNVYIGTSPGGESATPVNPEPLTGTSTALTGLHDGTRYYVTVRAINGLGVSSPSAEVSAIPTGATATSLHASSSRLLTGQTITLTAAVAPDPAGGTVAFSDRGHPISGCAAVRVSLGTGHASCTFRPATPGMHSLAAAFTGVAGHTASRSATDMVDVTSALRLVRVSAAPGAHLRLTLACARGAGACRGSVALTTSVTQHHKRRTETFGTARVTVAAGKQKTFTITLNRAGRQIVAAHGHVLVTVTVRLLVAGASSTIAVRHVAAS